MATLTGGSLKAIAPNDVKTRASQLNQLVDVIQEDVSGSVTRKKYQVFVTGGIGPGVTSSLFQTVYDQDFSLQTANPMFDITVGLYENGNVVTAPGVNTGKDSAQKLLFPSQSIMMREKVDIYKQFAANLLGDAGAAFYSPYGSVATATTMNSPLNDRIDAALFLSFKRLFSRDSLKRETFAIRLCRSGAMSDPVFHSNLVGKANIDITSTSGSTIFTDMGAGTNISTTFGGGVGNIVNSSNTNETVGLIFYDAGTVVLDVEKTFSGSQKMSGTIRAMSRAGDINGVTFPAGTTVMGALSFHADDDGHTVTHPTSQYGNSRATLVPDLFVSASVDDIVDHLSTTRFQSGSLTAMTFQNITNINSTIIFCRATADEFNYSTNPTYVNSDGRMRIIDVGQEETQRSFSFPTTVGLHDSQGRLLAVAKMSRPIEKNDEKDITFRIRLDF